MPDWPHGPLHRLGEAGAYMVTASTYDRRFLLNTPPRLTLVRDMLFELARETGWLLQAWAVLSNHYHFIAQSPHQAETLRPLIQKLHARSAKALNEEDQTPGRRVWFQYWDTLLTYQRSCFARLNYVHQNPVKHGLVRQAEAYPWCSAGWFARTATPAFYRRIRSMATDRLNVLDFPLD
jgi:putative transposase